VILVLSKRNFVILLLMLVVAFEGGGYLFNSEDLGNPLVKALSQNMTSNKQADLVNEENESKLNSQEVALNSTALNKNKKHLTRIEPDVDEFEADSALVHSAFMNEKGGGMASYSGFFNSKPANNTENANKWLDDVRSEIALENVFDQLKIDKEHTIDDEISDDEIITFSSDELVLLQGKEHNSEANEINVGLRQSNESSFSSSSINQVSEAVDEASPVPTPTDKAPSYKGQVRGYAMLYLMHPNARNTVVTELQTLLDSGVRDVFLAVLTDGTFGKDFDYLKYVLKTFNDYKRNVTLEVYLTNGPTMRLYQETDIEAGFNQMSPEDFRTLIIYDPSTREKFAKMVREVKPVLDYNTALNKNNRNFVVVMLEDNLNVESYRVMRSLAAAELSDNVQFIRNPCPKCYEGNDSDSLGDAVEFHHTNDLVKLDSGDGFTLDGQSYSFLWENKTGLTSDGVKSVVNVLKSKKAAFFGLWRSERQGIYGTKLHPDLRNYEVPTYEQVQVEMEILREGLNKM